jgi:hypothetical protein
MRIASNKMLPNTHSLTEITMSPRSKKEYVEAIHVRYKNASHHEKSLILDEFAPPAVTIENTPSEFLNDSDWLRNQRQRSGDDLPFTKTMKLSSNRSSRSGWQHIYPAQNG